MPTQIVTQIPARADALPTWEGLIAAYEAATAAEREAGRRHNEAETKLAKVKRPQAKLPDILTVTHDRDAVIIDGETRPLVWSHTFKTAEEIVGGVKGERQKHMLAALAEWEVAQAELDQTSGYSAAVAEEEQTGADFEAAVDARHDAVIAILKYPTAAPERVAFKRSLITDDFDFTAELGWIIDAMVAAQNPPPPASPAAPARGAWEAALAAYQAAYMAHEEASRADSLRAAHRLDRIPEDIRDAGLHYATVPRWRTVADLEADILLTSERKAFLRPIVKAWEDHRGAPMTVEQKADDELIEVAYDEVCRAERVLLATPAPDIRALLFKQRLLARESDDDKFGFTDLGAVAQAAASYLKDQALVIQHRDLGRRAGAHDPILHMGEFRPAAWIKAYAAEGGRITCTHEELIILPPAHSTMLSRDLISELDFTPWKFRALYAEAVERMGQGGDPIFTSQGALRNPTPIRLPVLDAIRVTFRTVAGRPEPVVEHVTNRPRKSV